MSQVEAKLSKNVTPSLVRRNWKENKEDIIRLLKNRGVYVTKDLKIHRTQIERAIQVLLQDTRFKTMNITELADLVE